MAKMKTGAKIGIFALTTCVVIASGFGICKFGFADKGKNPIDKIKEVITTTSPKENIKTFEVEKEKYYLAIEGKDTLKYTLETSTGENKIEFTSSDESIVSVDSNGKLVGKSKGTTTVKLTAYTVEKEVEVLVTDLIEKMPKEEDVKKPLLYCSSGKSGEKKVCKNYTSEENDLLDEILKSRVDDAGRGSRAGAVAAARFLALEFPYRIPYFSENGRLNKGIKGDGNAYADGEGRFYHEGLYLNADRKSVLDPKGIKYGPKPWGQQLYSVPSKGNRPNGLDCSGFITWIIKNGGSESQDRGAGIHGGVDDMTDLGPKYKLSERVPKKDLKVGDLLSGGDVPVNGGHIALIAGITEDKVYVAECLWSGTGYFGAIIRTYKWDELQTKGRFYWTVDLDGFYTEGDGNLTDYWYTEEA